MRRRLLVLFLTACAALPAGCTAASPTPEPSRTTASPTAPGQSQTPRPTRTGKDRPASMAALGDSITRGTNACADRFGDCPEASWATGTTVDSHARLIGQPGGNLASAGARVADLPAQADAAVPLRPAYVTILIGANDACRQSVDRMTTVADFRADLDSALRKIKRGVPGARLLLVSIPDLYQLWAIGHADQNATSRWAFGLCPAMLANPTSAAPEDEARRQRVRGQVVAYNAAIATACAAYGANCRTDGGAAFRFAFRPEHVSSIDFFHPSVAGQAELARLTNDVGYQW